MLRRGEGVLLCVSGGPDSVALLFLFLELTKEFDLRLHVAHLNHLLRGSESDEDESFVRNLAEKLKLPVTIHKMDIESKAKELGRSIEETARMARYDFFYDAARKEKLQKIAVAHTQDDQAETVLMRLIRGCGLGGLASIPPKRQAEDKFIIRPLINVSRAEIEEYLKEKKVTPRHDSTNLKPLYFRNKIRLELLPLLEREYNKNIKEILANTAELLRGDYEYISQQSQEAFRGVTKKHPPGVAISLKRLAGYPLPLKRRILRRAIEEVKGDLRRIELRHLKEIEDFLSQAKGGSCLDLPGGVSLRKDKEALRIWLEKS